MQTYQRFIVAAHSNRSCEKDGQKYADLESWNTARKLENCPLPHSGQSSLLSKPARRAKSAISGAQTPGTAAALELVMGRGEVPVPREGCTTMIKQNLSGSANINVLDEAQLGKVTGGHRGGYRKYNYGHCYDKKRYDYCNSKSDYNYSDCYDSKSYCDDSDYRSDDGCYDYDSK
jgi:hypothetical protein